MLLILADDGVIDDEGGQQNSTDKGVQQKSTNGDYLHNKHPVLRSTAQI